MAVDESINIKSERLNVEPGKSVTAVNNDQDSNDSDIPTRNLTNEDSDDDHTEAAVEETQEESEYITPQKEQIVVGKFVLVKVKGDSRKKTTYRYVATVMHRVHSVYLSKIQSNYEYFHYTYYKLAAFL
ncbi:hypothetical protein FQA39_LY06430 [Lamprigera yunnana]|nr:hypothetical protein FQA39_LY06430 [Lamprigera yunnana]